MENTGRSSRGLRGYRQGRGHTPGLRGKRCRPGCRTRRPCSAVATVTGAVPARSGPPLVIMCDLGGPTVTSAPGTSGDLLYARADQGWHESLLLSRQPWACQGSVLWIGLWVI
jgi:hypothetical protein